MKKLEIKIRFGGVMPGDSRIRLVWDDFFSTSDCRKGCNAAGAKYILDDLEGLDKTRLKDIIDEYFYRVYYQVYRENGIMPANVYDPDLLGILGLKPDADYEQIKRRFRELAKKYHPDLGGDSERMIELLDAYHKLVDR